MATIKSTLALEDKMTPTFSRIEQEAMANLKAYQQVDRQIKSLEKTMNALEKSGKGETEMALRIRRGLG